MCSKNDSDATYCSEVEEQIRTTCRRKKWKLENVPLRRSQRLSQMSSAPVKFSWDNVRITKAGILKVITRKRVQANTCSPDIFSVQDLLEEQEFIGQLNNICANDHLNCPTKHVKSLKHQGDVPLDLLEKSKVSANKTSAGDLEKVNNGEETTENNDNINLFPKKKIGRKRTLKYPQNFNNLIKLSVIEDVLVENSPKNLAKIKASKGNSSSKKPDQINLFPNKKIGRPRKLKCLENCNNHIKPPEIKKVLVENSPKNITLEHMIENIETDFNNINKSLQISIAKTKNSKVNSFPRKPRKSKNKTGMFPSKTATVATATETQELLEDTFNQNMSPNVPKKCVVKRDKSSKLLESNFCNTSAADLVINSEFEFEKKELDSLIYQKLQPMSDRKKNIQISFENSTDFPNKKIKLSNELIMTNQIQKTPKIEKSIGKKMIITKNTLNSEISKTKANIQNRQLLNQSTSENSSKTLSNEVLKIKRSISLYKDNNVIENPNNLLNIKSEPLTPLEITPRSGNVTNSENRFEKSSKIENLTSVETKDSPRDKNFNANSQNINQKFSGDLKISQKSCKLSETIKTRQITSNVKESKRDAENVKTERNLPPKSLKRRKSCTKSFKETIKTDTKSVKIISNKNNKSPSKIQNKKIPTLNKNIMKFFDKSLYLDKIKTSTVYSHNNITNLQIPPTPADSTQDPLRKSILPDMYPPHFKYQLPPEAVLNHPLSLPYPQSSNVMTPDDTVTTELLESSSSSPSLPESLCELLQTKDIKEILNVDKVSYRLYNYHVQALALILNLHVDYLVEILDKIMNMKVEVLKNINEAVKRPFVPDTDLFANTPEDIGENGEMVFSSQSPKMRRFSAIKVDI